MRTMLMTLVLIISATAAVTHADTYTVRFVDPANWGANHCRVHVWNIDENGLTTDYKAWNDDDEMKNIHSYVLIDGSYHRVYEYTFEWDNTPTKIIFHRVDNSGLAQTSDLDFNNDATYLFVDKNSGLTTEQAILDPATEIFPESSLPMTTIYFADTKGWGADNTLVHLWNNPLGEYSPWDENPSMTDTGKYVLVNGAWVKLYSFSFFFPGLTEEDEAGLILHNDIVNLQLSIVPDAVYYYDSAASQGLILENPEIRDSLPEFTVYFADTGSWTNDKTQVHIWNSIPADHPAYSDFVLDPTMTDTGKYCRINDVWAKVYMFSFVNNASYNSVLFHCQSMNAQTADLELKDGALYHYAGDHQPVRYIENPVTFDEIPDEDPRKATLYVNLGANQMMQAGLWNEPCAHLYRRTGEESSYESLLPEYGSEQYSSEIMTYVRDGFYKIEIDDINNFNDVIFYYARYKDGQWTYESLAFPASRGPYNDPTTWATYVYDIGIDCVHQSYLTPYEYNRGWDEIPTELFMAGNSIVSGFEVAEGEYDTIRLEHAVSIESDDDVYIHKFHIDDGDIAMFKLSRFNVFKAAARHGFTLADDTYNFQRGWATFNLGIIGFQQDENDAYWYDKFIYSPGNGESRQVRFYINNSVDFNSYNQYPWRIGDGEGGVDDGDYWLVIDLHAADHSLTLLDFDPNPTVTLTSYAVETIEPGDNVTIGLDNTDPHYAAVSNGRVGINRVNMLTAKGIVHGQEPATIEERNYQVLFTLSTDGLDIATATETGLEVTFPYLTPGKEVKAGVRARYTDTETGRSFCSRINYKKAVAEEPAFPTPDSNNLTGVKYLYYANDADRMSGTYTLGGCVDLPFSLTESTTYAYYPDYSVESVGTSTRSGDDISSSIVYAGHELSTHGDFGTFLGKSSDTPWTPYDGESEYTPQNNWAEYVIAEGKLPLFIHTMGIDAAQSNRLDGNAVVQLHALYPFLTVKTAAAATAPRKARALAADADDDTNDGDTNDGDDVNNPTIDPVGLQLTSYRTSAPSTVNFSGKTISGLDTIEIGDETTEAIYHTISGVRLTGRPTLPGLYLETRGTTTRKVIVK